MKQQETKPQPGDLAYLAQTERDALAFLSGHEQDVIDLASALIAAPSPNLPGDETAPANVIHRALTRLGLPAATVLSNAPNRPNLIVRIEGALPGPALGLCGHIDTKPVGDAASEWKTDPFVPTLQGDQLFGLGACDMKGAVAAMILAGAAYKSVADRAAGSLTLIFTADEENGSAHGAEFLARSRALDVDAIILGEPSGITSDWEALRIVSRGVCGFTVEVRGRQAHSSLSDEIPTVNAVQSMAAILTELGTRLKVRYPEHPLCPAGPTVNLGVRATGGVGYGVVPGYADFWSDVRTTPGMTQHALLEDINSALGQMGTATVGVDVSVALAPPPLAWIEPTELAPEHPAVLACAHAARNVLGSAPPLAAFPGGTDASAFQGLGDIPTVSAFGPGMLPLAHSANEWVSARSLIQASQMYVITALAYGQNDYSLSNHDTAMQRSDAM